MRRAAVEEAVVGFENCSKWPNLTLHVDVKKITHDLRSHIRDVGLGRLTKLLSYVVLCSIMLLHNFLNSLVGLWVGFCLTRPISLCLVHFCVCALCFSYMLYYCNMVRWTWWNRSSILRTSTSFSALTLFGLVIWPIKTRPWYIYNV